MDPYEQRLRDEVLYLHSLWHQGPPTNPNPNPNPNFNPSRHLLQPSNPTNFKKQQKRTRGRRGRGGKKNLNPPEFDLSQVSGIEWPCKSPSDTSPATTASGWPKLNLNPTPVTRLPSAEEKSRFAATQLQQKGLKAVQEFFTSNVDSDEDMEDEDDDDDDDDDDECVEYKFFLKVFMGDTDLRGYYEKNFWGGEFCCLVCGGIGEKVGKRFRDCIALVQHSIAIAKTKKMRAHRAFGQVICKVLGWDINRLPTSVLSACDPLSISVVKPGELQGSADGATENSDVLNKNSGLENVNNGELVPNEVSDVCAKEELETGTVVGIPNDVTPDLMVCENSLAVADSNKDLEGLDQGNSLVTADSNECTEGLDQGVSSIVDGNTEGVVNKLESFQEDGLGKELENNRNENGALYGQKEDDTDQN